VLRSHWRGSSPPRSTPGRARTTCIGSPGSCWQHNTRPLRFAAAAGFCEELVSPRYAVIDGRAADRVRMVKSL